MSKVAVILNQQQKMFRIINREASMLASGPLGDKENLKSSLRENECGAKVPNTATMNGLSSRLHYQRIVMLDWIFAFVTFAQFLMLYAYFQLDLRGNSMAVVYCQFSMASALSCCIVLFLKFQAESHYAQLTRKATSSCTDLITKLLLCLVIPYCFLDSVQIKSSYYTTLADGSSGDMDFDFKLNYLLLIMSVFKNWYFSSEILIRSYYRTAQAQRICQLYNSQPDFNFCARCLFKDYPFAFVTIVSLVSVLLFTFMFRVAEGPIADTSPRKSYSNMLWMTIITVTTVGYGDYSPQTPIGRIISVVVVSWGVLIVSVMVVVLTNAFAMDRNQSQSLSIINKLEAKDQLKEVAGMYIRESLWRVWKNHKMGIRRGEKLRERKLKVRFRLLRRVKNNSIIAEGQMDFYSEMSRQFDRAFINIENLSANNMMLINFLHEEILFKEEKKLTDPMRITTRNKLKTKKNTLARM